MKFVTIAAPSQAKVTEKMSRFLAFAHPAASPDEARALVARYRNEYHDARHVCWAYVTGADRATFLSSDDGEPSGTAGRPILGQINSAGLTDIVVVVVRYFGGIKLGTSGLIAAYREAARQAIADAPRVEREELTDITIRFGYLEMNDVMTLVKSLPDVTVLTQTFDNTCTLSLRLPLPLLPRFQKWQ